MRQPHDDLAASVAVEVLIIDAVHGGAAALNGAETAVGVALQPEHHDLQGLFIAAAAQEHQRLLDAVILQIHHLDRLDVPAAEGRGVLVALVDEAVDLLGQAGILLCHTGQGEQLLHGGVEEGAAGQHGGQRQSCQQQDTLFRGMLHSGPSVRL